MKQHRIVLFVVLVCVALGLAGGAIYIAIDRTHDQTDENRLLFKFACALPLAVAERLDQLVVGALGDTQDPERIRTLKAYHRDFQRGKDICPPISREESTRLAKILIDLGGKPPDPQPGR